MKTKQEVGMLNLRPYGNYPPYTAYARIKPHIREPIIKVNDRDYVGYPQVLVDVFGNFYGFDWGDLLNTGESGMFIVRLDDGVDTIVDKV
jgi:hypothetical protein